MCRGCSSSGEQWPPVAAGTETWTQPPPRVAPTTAGRRRRRRVEEEKEEEADFPSSLSSSSRRSASTASAAAAETSPLVGGLDFLPLFPSLPASATTATRGSSAASSHPGPVAQTSTSSWRTRGYFPRMWRSKTVKEVFPFSPFLPSFASSSSSLPRNASKNAEFGPANEFSREL